MNVVDFETLEKFDYILCNVRILGQLKPDDKLYDIDGVLHIQEPSLFSGLSRMVGNHNRARSIDVIDRDTNFAIELLNLLMESKYVNHDLIGGRINQSKIMLFGIKRESRLAEIEVLIGILSNAKTGLFHLLTTYKGDIDIGTKITGICDRIDCNLVLCVQSIIINHGNIQICGKDASNFGQ